MASGGKTIADNLAIIEGLGPVVPSTSVPDYISLKHASRVEVVIHAKNATTVTGSAISLLQATTVAGGSAKALAFTTYYAVVDTAASDVMVEATATSNTFTPPTTNSKSYLYRIPIDPASLDVAGGFDCLRAVTADATAQTITVLYLVETKYGGNAVLTPSLIVD